MAGTNTSNVAFKVISEKFSRYKLEGGVDVRLKVLAETITETTEKGEVEIDVKTDEKTRLTYPPDFDMSEFERLDSSGRPRRTKKLKILRRKEAINIYETKKAIILVGSYLASISFSDVKINNYELALHLDYSVATQIVPKHTFNQAY